MDRNPTKTEARRAKREARLGPGAACCWCGHGALEALIQVRAPELAAVLQAKLLESHHVLGRAHDPKLTMILCRNCHAEATECYARGEVPLRPQPNVLDRLLACLQAVAAFLDGLREAIERWIEEIKVLIADLDRRFPGWRGPGT